MHRSGPVASLVRALALVLTLAAPLSAVAAWPERPVRVIVPYAPGGNTDGIARVTAQALQEAFGQPFVVENRVGGNGIVAAEAVARAAPDGYTLFLVAQPVLAIVPAMIKVSFDPVTDFTPISVVGTNPFVFSVHRSVPVASLTEWLTWARRQPAGSLNYSSGSVGASSHLVMVLLLDRTGVRAEHVPYRGGALSLQALVAGEVPMGFNNLSEALPFTRSGELRALAVSGAARSRQLPEVPTVIESGYPGFEVVTWNGLVGPARLAPEVVERAAAEIRRRASTDAAFVQRLEGLGVDSLGNTPAQFGAMIRADRQRWAEAVRLSGAKVD
jgi:tripartite-type tricarboxylate transporter receptor subunit TctC